MFFLFQEPKKYHVLNDIFRYQDETFEDTENDETIDGTVCLILIISSPFSQLVCCFYRKLLNKRYLMQLYNVYNLFSW